MGGRLTFHSTGGDVNNLPVTCTSGEATFKAALRVRVQAGTTVEVFGTGFDFELGVFADLIEYEATLNTTSSCELFLTESLDVNIGAFAHAVVELDYKTFGVSPAVVTTILDVPLPSLCLTRPVSTSLTALPTETDIFTSTLGSDTWSSYPYTASSMSTSTGGIFLQNPSSITATGPMASPTGISVPTSNGTITAPASLTTSTVYSTDIKTITSCSSTVLHCPASLATEILITSTTIVYTTVCPVGQTQSSSITMPQSKSVSVQAVTVNTATVIISPLPLTPCETPIVSTVYTPTFVNPTYTMPTATAFSVPYPNWQSTVTATVYNTIPVTQSVASVVATSAPVYTHLSYVSGVPKASANATFSTSALTPTTPVTFTGSAGHSVSSSSRLLVLLGVALLATL